MDRTWPRSEYARHRTMVIARHRVVFVPVPKSGCTSLLWLLARASSLNPARFIDSAKPEVTRTMAIHDLDLWPESHRWDRLTAEQQAHVESDDTWLRFTVVRHPARRVWSAWQDKLLLRQPGFVDRFGGTEWFPGIPADPEQIVAEFRAFVRALAHPAERRPLDPHWMPQTTLHAAGPSLNHIGRTEDMASVVDLLVQRLGSEHAEPLERENSGLLPFDVALFDDETRTIVNELYADDFAELGYEPLAPPTEGLDRWSAETGPLLSATCQLVERHQRIGDLYRAVRRLQQEQVAPSPVGA